MKIGKMKKILASVLVFALGIGIINNGVINANAGETTTPETPENSRVDVEGLKTSKTAEYDPDTGLAKITLDAFTTGETISSEETVPTDIVLVLDQSGSMAEDITITTEADYELVAEKGTTTIKDLYNCWGEVFLVHYNQNKKYFVQLDDGNYYPLNIKQQYSNLFNLDMILSYTDASGNEVEISREHWDWKVLWNRDKAVNIDYNIYEYTETTRRTSKINALKDTAKGFINKVVEENSKSNTDIDHRVAVVGFANGDEWGRNDYNYSNTELFIGNNQYTYNNGAQSQYGNALVTPETALDSINILEADGGTLINYGLEMANGIFANNQDNQGRNRIVVVLTDGQPGWSGFDNVYANQAISEAYTLKNTYGASVYSVGIFDGANENDETTQSNKFMHYVSNNYKEARDMWNPGTKTDNKYYMSASNANGLSEIFESIWDDISTPDISLNENTVIKDFISDYFVYDEEVSDLKVEKIACSGKDTNGNYEFKGEKIDITTDPKIKITTNENSVSVTGYNFDENFVEVDDKGTARGYKLRITFSVKPIDGFIGGNQVPTNKAESGVYKDANTTTPTENFDYPTVNVPISYHYNVDHAAMYLTDDWRHFDKMLDELNYTTNDNTGNHNLNENFVNDFVEITYTFKKGNQIIGTYKVEEKATSGVWKFNSGYTTNGLRNEDKEDYTISVEVKPIVGNSSSLENDVDGNKDASLYIFKPSVESYDKDGLNIGDKHKLIESVEDIDEWYCNAAVPKGVLPSGTKPKLSFTYSLVGGGEIDIDNDVYTATEAGTHEVQYNVFANNENITQWTHKDHDNTLKQCDGNCENNHFYIRVIGGTIDITKSISKDDLNKYDFSDGDPIFIFKVVNDNTNDTYYRSVRITKNGNNYDYSDIPTLTGLSKGTYTVTELPSFKFNYSGSKVPQGTFVSEVDNGVKVKIEDGSLNVKIEFTNTPDSNEYETDNDIVVNSFSKNPDGSISIKQDWLNGTEIVTPSGN